MSLQEAILPTPQVRTITKEISNILILTGIDLLGLPGVTPCPSESSRVWDPANEMRSNPSYCIITPTLPFFISATNSSAWVSLVQQREIL